MMSFSGDFVTIHVGARLAKKRIYPNAMRLPRNFIAILSEERPVRIRYWYAMIKLVRAI